MAAALQQLRVHRSAALILTAFALVVTGLWVIAAALFGAAIGAGAGLIASGLALLVVEGLCEDTR